MPTLPLALNTPAFKAKWAEYEAFRREAKFKKLVPRTVQTRWNTFDKWGHEVAIQALDEAMQNQWQGIFPPKGMPANRGGSEFSGSF